MLQPVDLNETISNPKGVFINIPRVEDTNPEHNREEIFCNQAFKYNENGEKEMLDFYNITLPNDVIIDGTDVSYATFTVDSSKVDINNQYADTTHSILLSKLDKDNPKELAPVRIKVKDNETKETVVYEVQPEEIKQALDERHERYKNEQKLKEQPNKSLNERAAQAKQVSAEQAKNAIEQTKEQEIAF